MENTYMDNIEIFRNFIFYINGCDTVEKNYGTIEDYCEL